MAQPLTNQARRVVVTGIGAISSLANNARDTWQRIVNGETGGPDW